MTLSILSHPMTYPLSLQKKKKKEKERKKKRARSECCVLIWVVQLIKLFDDFSPFIE